MHSRRVMDVKSLVRDALTILNEAQEAAYAETDTRLNSIEILLLAAMEGLDEIEEAWRSLKDELGWQ